MKRALFGVVVSAVLFCGLGAAQAEGITYTFDATGSGSLGGVAFANAAFTITVTADTLSIVNCGGSVLSVDSLSADISITGFDTATILSSTRLFDNNGASVLGFSQGSCAGFDYLDISNSAFATYNLATAIGPIFDPSPFAVGQFHDVPTTGGTLTVSSARDVTFNAFTACGGGGPIPQASSSFSAEPGLRGFVGGVSYGVAE
jgi:hypothetical protein